LSDKLESKLLENWTDESQSYSESIRKELYSEQKEAWQKLLKNTIKSDNSLKVLDAGTGPGFFAIILSEIGHQVTAVDVTAAMLEEAKKNALLYFKELTAQPSIDFLLSDTSSLPSSKENFFDVVLSRNLLWGLIDPLATLREWLRILKPGGQLIIFDANWNLRHFDAEQEKAHQRDLDDYRRLFNKEPIVHTPKMVSFRKSLPLCRVKRPEWDVEALIKEGFQDITTSFGPFGPIQSPDHEVLFRSTPLFMITARKKE
jgi:ubiquinone/menaquinone biosynthesis C-methylase UbiE